MKFRTTLQLFGKTATGLEVPAKVVASLASGKRPPVRVTIKGHTYRSTVAPMGGKFMLPASAENRSGAGVAAGDRLEVDLVLDTEPREVVEPPDFKKALDRDTQARRVFEGSPTGTGGSTCSRSRARRPPRPESAASSRRSARCGVREEVRLEVAGGYGGSGFTRRNGVAENRNRRC